MPNYKNANTLNRRRSRRSRSRSRRRFSTRKSKLTKLGLAMSGLTIGAGLYSFYKKSVLPKQGFVFTPAFEEKGQNCLLIIDPQVDFMDNPLDPLNPGSLAVSGAREDMRKLGEFIEKNINKINSICVTLDTHSLFHIGNAHAYKEEETPYPVPYDQNLHHAKQGDKVPGLDDHIHSYANKLTKQKKTHMLWPLHCQLGTKGHAVYEPLYEKLKNWSNKSLTEVRYVIKGCDTRYENFSVFRSAGVDKHSYSNPNKESYKFNVDLAKHLYQFPNLYIAGEARTHCVYDSTADYVEWVNSKGNPKNQQIYVLWDCMSDVQIPNVDDFFAKNREAFSDLISSNKFMHKVKDSKDLTI